MTVGQTQVVLLSLRENCGQDVSALDSVGGGGGCGVGGVSGVRGSPVHRFLNTLLEQ